MILFKYFIAITLTQFLISCTLSPPLKTKQASKQAKIKIHNEDRQLATNTDREDYRILNFANNNCTDDSFIQFEKIASKKNLNKDSSFKNNLVELGIKSIIFNFTSLVKINEVSINLSTGYLVVSAHCNYPYFSEFLDKVLIPFSLTNLDTFNEYKDSYVGRIKSGQPNLAVPLPHPNTPDNSKVLLHKIKLLSIYEELIMNYRAIDVLILLPFDSTIDQISNSIIFNQACKKTLDSLIRSLPENPKSNLSRVSSVVLQMETNLNRSSERIYGTSETPGIAIVEYGCNKTENYFNELFHMIRKTNSDNMNFTEDLSTVEGLNEAMLEDINNRVIRD